MTKQTRMAIVAAIALVACVAIVALVPVNYVIWSPGASIDVSEAIKIENSGRDLNKINGKLLLTTVSMTTYEHQVTLPEVIVGYLLPDQEVLPRDLIYPPGASADEINQTETQSLEVSQNSAIAAGLRAVGVPVMQLPMVVSVSASGSAIDILKPGDLIEKVDGKSVKTVLDIMEALATHQVGDQIVLSFYRGEQKIQKTITVRSTNDHPDQKTLGVTYDLGYRHNPQVDFGIATDLGGASAGLPFALAVTNALGSSDLLNGRIVAATGTINDKGEVGAVGGLREKLAAAEASGAELFIFPKANCADLADSSVRLVPVANLNDAIQTLLGTKTFTCR